MIDFKSKDEGTWFYFDDTDHSNGGVKLRLLSPAEEDLVDRKSTKVTKKPIRGVMTEDRDTNSIVRNKLTYTKWIVDWDGVSLDGTVLECNGENIMTMMTQVTMFARFVLAKILDMGDESKLTSEARVKNLKSSSPGE